MLSCWLHYRAAYDCVVVNTSRFWVSRTAGAVGIHGLNLSPSEYGQQVCAFLCGDVRQASLGSSLHSEWLGVTCKALSQIEARTYVYRQCIYECKYI